MRRGNEISEIDDRELQVVPVRSIMEAVTFCLYGGKVDDIYRNINRREKAKANANVAFEIVIEMDDGSELVVKRSWTTGAVSDPKPRDLTERLVVVRDGKRVSVQNQEIWQDFIRAAIPPGITQFFFFDGEKIQEIAADDHSEVRLKSSLEAALGIQYINRLASDIIYIKQEERKGFVEISDEDLEFIQSELKREKSKQTRKGQERDGLQSELGGFRAQLDESKKRFEATFHAAPESREVMSARRCANRRKSVCWPPTDWRRWKARFAVCVKRRCPSVSRASCSMAYGGRLMLSGSLPAARQSRKTLLCLRSALCG